MPEIARIDQEHLALIRRNIEQFILRCAGQYIKSPGASLLDIAPQDHEHISAAFDTNQVKRQTLDIDPHSGATYVADLCDPPSQELFERFDFIQCTEVLEHTLQPFNAVESLFSMLKPNGICFVTVPFDLRIHGPLPDCWRFTEHGLRSLFQDFRILELNGLENPERFLMPIHYTLVAQKPA